jgi:hypothetical protein
MRAARQEGKGIARLRCRWQSEPMPGAVLHRFTREDYYRLAEGGALSPNERVELLDGRVVDMFPIGPFHGSTVRGW